ncbi:MFS transporter [Thalassobacillus devorans]|uniref:MFS transporter n=1 Tax=Thalassobacillus devorans TaxID=279813 RepID=UPI000A1CC44A|nr:MFS transporter [Thalassobacillus devorans]
MYLFKDKNFLLIWLARVISQLGDWVLLIVLPFYVYESTGSSLATGGMFIVQVFPRLLFGSIAGVLVEKWDKRKTLIWVDILRSMILFLLFIPLDSLWIFFVAAFLQNVVGTLFMPAQRTLLFDLVGREHIGDANSITVVSDNVVRLAGPSIGGALLGLGGLHIAVGVDIATYVLSAFFLSLISHHTSVDTPEQLQSVGERWIQFWGNWLKGLGLVKNLRIVLLVFCIMSVTWIAQGMVNVLFVLFVKDILGAGATELGWIESAEGIGGLVGGYLLFKLNKKISPFSIIFSSLILTGILFLLIFNIPILLVVILLNILLGIPNIMYSVRLETLLQEYVPKNYLSRVFGSYQTTVSLMMIFGMGLASILPNIIGIINTLNIAGSMFLAVAVITLKPLKKLTREFKHGVSRSSSDAKVSQ